MPTQPPTQLMSAEGAASLSFRDLARKRAPGESCDLCSAPIGDPHAHLLEIAKRRVMCACPACAILFSDSRARFRRIPPEIRSIPDCGITDAHWAALEIPIQLAFLFRATATEQRMALYPSPGGAIESVISEEVWAEIVADEPRLQDLEDDVQALLVNRLTEPYQYYVAPLDRCFELAGLVRVHWKGFTGGTELWRRLGAFFEELSRSAEARAGVRHA